eukprot:7580724-Alexandrium_andersonii.AAC.1
MWSGFGWRFRAYSQVSQLVTELRCGAQRLWRCPELTSSSGAALVPRPSEVPPSVPCPLRSLWMRA